MGISRRSAIKGLAAVSASAGVASCSRGHRPTGQIETGSFGQAPEIPADPKRLLLNHGHAVEVMEKEGIDLLICSDPVNIQYLTNQQPVDGKVGVDGQTYAALSASPKRKPTLIGSRISYFFDAPDPALTSEVDFRFYGTPAEPEIFEQLERGADIAAAPAKAFYLPRVHDEAPLSTLESRRFKQLERALVELTASAEAAILAEILATDFPNKTIAIDNLRLRSVVERSGMDLQIKDGERLIRQVRLRKSPLEITYMKYAAKANRLAARSAALAVREGATFRDVRLEFAKACGTYRHEPQFLMLDTHTSDLFGGEITEGRSFLMDAVSSFQGYFGDYGRTVCVGEPNRKMKQITDVLSNVWDHILPELKPGTSYADIYGMATKLYKDSGVDANFAVNPHNVGMHHHDEPSAKDFGIGFSKENIVLTENMVVSIDMPFLDVGLGGSAHLEDLVLITKDGPELMNDSSDRLIIV